MLIKHFLDVAILGLSGTMRYCNVRGGSEIIFQGFKLDERPPIINNNNGLITHSQSDSCMS